MLTLTFGRHILTSLPSYWCSVVHQEIILKRAADLAEALYSMPRQQLSLPPTQSPPMNGTSEFNHYSNQLAAVKDPQTQWDDSWSHRYPAIAY